MNNRLAYYLGFLAADGWISKNALGFALKRSDRESVEYMAELTSKIVQKPVNVVDYESKCSNGKYYPTSRFVVTSKELIEMLGIFGIVQAKSYKDNNFLENIPDENKLAFIIGYFDGDGGITIYNKNQSNFSVTLTITGRKIPLQHMINFMSEDWRWRQVYDTETYVISIVRHEDIINFAKKYLSFKNEIKLLKRKQEEFEYILENYKNIKEKPKEYTAKIYNEAKNKKKYIYKTTCPICGKEMRVGSSVCIDCYHDQMRKHIPPQDILEDLLKTETYESIGKMYNVTGKSVRNWADYYGISEIKIINHNREGLDLEVLKAFLTCFSIKNTAEITNIPDWKAHDIIYKYFGDKCTKVFITAGQPIANNLGLVFPSTKKAAIWCGNPKLDGHILTVTQGKRLKAGGYCWRKISLEEYSSGLLSNLGKTEHSEAYISMIKIYNELLNNNTPK